MINSPDTGLRLSTSYQYVEVSSINVLQGFEIKSIEMCVGWFEYLAIEKRKYG